jgi:hypothetical protein
VCVRPTGKLNKFTVSFKGCRGYWNSSWHWRGVDVSSQLKKIIAGHICKVQSRALLQMLPMVGSLDPLQGDALLHKGMRSRNYVLTPHSYSPMNRSYGVSDISFVTDGMIIPSQLNFQSSL